MHKVIDYLEKKVAIPYLHIAVATATQMKQSNIKKVGLLGTKYTMEQNFYNLRIEQKGIEVIVPNETEQNQVNDIIYEELCLGIINDSSKKYYQRVIKRLVRMEQKALF